MMARSPFLPSLSICSRSHRSKGRILSPLSPTSSSSGRDPRSAMASAMATKRLRKEYLAMQKKPVENIQAVPLDSNILEWHYVITGTEGSPYEGGYYHGKLKFPPEYPMKPPSVMMMTPNGRFKTNTRLCLSMSDFHPETWNPMWSVSSILTGLYSFMLENQATLGSITTTDAQKRKYAAASLEANCSNPLFRKLFPDLVDLHDQRVREQALLKQLSPSPSGDNAPLLSSSGSSGGGVALAGPDKGAIDNMSTALFAALGLAVVGAAVLYYVV